MAIQHTLLYFSGVADDAGTGGKELTAPHGQDVLTDMERLSLPGDDEKVVQGFGGTLARRKEVVRSALDFLKKNHDSRGKLIIYGYSAGGINSLELCRALQVVGQEVTLLVTVDVSARADLLTIVNPLASSPAVNRSVPANVKRTRNYFQTDEGLPALSRAKAGPAHGPNVQNINCDDLSFDNTIVSGKSRHAQMQDMTRHKVRQDMVVELHRQ